MNLLIMLRRTMGLKDLGELYNSLLDLGMIMEVDVLKCDGQWPSSKQALAISTNFSDIWSH